MTVSSVVQEESIFTLGLEPKIVRFKLHYIIDLATESKQPLAGAMGDEI